MTPAIARPQYDVQSWKASKWSALCLAGVFTGLHVVMSMFQGPLCMFMFQNLLCIVTLKRNILGTVSRRCLNRRRPELNLTSQFFWLNIEIILLSLCSLVDTQNVWLKVSRAMCGGVSIVNDLTLKKIESSLSEEKFGGGCENNVIHSKQGKNCITPWLLMPKRYIVIMFFFSIITLWPRVTSIIFLIMFFTTDQTRDSSWLRSLPFSFISQIKSFRPYWILVTVCLPRRNNVCWFFRFLGWCLQGLGRPIFGRNCNMESFFDWWGNNLDCVVSFNWRLLLHWWVPSKILKMGWW